MCVYLIGSSKFCHISLIVCFLTIVLHHQQREYSNVSTLLALCTYSQTSDSRGNTNNQVLSPTLYLHSIYPSSFILLSLTPPSYSTPDRIYRTHLAFIHIREYSQSHTHYTHSTVPSFHVYSTLLYSRIPAFLYIYSHFIPYTVRIIYPSVGTRIPNFT